LHATLETLTGGTAMLSGTAIINSGSLFADGTDSVIKILGSVVSGGGSAIVGDGVVDIAGSVYGENVSFLSTGTGGLVIDDSNSNQTAFSGAILDFGIGLRGRSHANHAQYIELSSVGFISGAISGSYDTSTHTLAVTSGGTEVAQITISGSYATVDFHFTSGSDGTVRITDPERRFHAADGIVQSTAVHSANIALLGSYIANFAADNRGGVLVASAWQTEPVPLLVHPHG